MRTPFETKETKRERNIEKQIYIFLRNNLAWSNVTCKNNNREEARKKNVCEVKWRKKKYAAAATEEEEEKKYLMEKNWNTSYQQHQVNWLSLRRRDTHFKLNRYDNL